MIFATLLALAGTPDPRAESVAALQLFQDACVKGELRIAKDNAEVVSRDKANSLGWWLNFQPAATTQTFIKVNRPRFTWIVMSKYAATHGKKLESSCALLTSVTRRDDALRYFQNRPDGLKVNQFWDHGMYEDRWFVEDPAGAYRQEMRIRHDGYLALKSETLRNVGN